MTENMSRFWSMHANDASTDPGIICPFLPRISTISRHMHLCIINRQENRITVKLARLIACRNEYFIAARMCSMTWSVCKVGAQASLLQPTIFQPTFLRTKPGQIFRVLLQPPARRSNFVIKLRSSRNDSGVTKNRYSRLHTGTNQVVLYKLNSSYIGLLLGKVVNCCPFACVCCLRAVMTLYGVAWN